MPRFFFRSVGVIRWRMAPNTDVILASALTLPV
jgi:hypothetical protein